jgi:hypothetical protein
MLRKPFDRELRIETARLRQSEFRLGVVPLRGLSPRQKDVGKVGPVSCVNPSLKLSNRRVKPTQTSLANAQDLPAESRWDLVNFLESRRRIPPWQPGGALEGPGQAADLETRGRYLVGEGQ